MKKHTAKHINDEKTNKHQICSKLEYAQIMARRNRRAECPDNEIFLKQVLTECPDNEISLKQVIETTNK